MKSIKKYAPFILVFFCCLSFSFQTSKQNANTSPLSLSDVEGIFGKGFKAEAPTKIGEIQSCRFSNKDYTIQLSIQPAYGMKLADYNKMMSPKTVTWKPISNDLDGAMIEIREDKKDDLASTPAVTYIRKDKYVRLQILGSYYSYDNSKMPKLREEMRDKLVKLKRVP